MSAAHAATYEQHVTNGYLWKIDWRCSCGKSGAAHDGQRGLSLRSARAAHRRHVAAAQKRELEAAL